MVVFLVCGGRTFGHFLPKWKFSQDPKDRELYESRKKEYKFIHDTLTTLANKYVDNFNKEEMLPDIEVVHGTANGADTAGEDWGLINYTRLRPFEPDIKQFGSPVAFFVRNEAMAEYCHTKALLDNVVVCIPFKGGSGTNDMVKRIQRVNKNLNSKQQIIIEDMREKYGN